LGYRRFKFNEELHCNSFKPTGFDGTCYYVPCSAESRERRPAFSQSAFGWRALGTIDLLIHFLGFSLKLFEFEWQL